MMEEISDFDFIINALKRFIVRLEGLKQDEEIKIGGEIVLMDINDHVKMAQNAIAGITERQDEKMIRFHSVIVGVALNMWIRDLENSTSILKEKTFGVNLLLDDTQKTISKCKKLLGIYCKQEQNRPN